MRNKPMPIMLHIGATKETVEKVTKAITTIMTVKVSDPVILKALDVFDGSLRVENTNIHNCHFEAKQ